MVVLSLSALFGSFAAEALVFARAVRRTKDWPWKKPSEPSIAPFFCAVVLRLAIGTGLGGILGASGQVCGPLGAMAAGLAAPALLEHLARSAKQLTGLESGHGR